MQIKGKQERIDYLELSLTDQKEIVKSCLNYVNPENFTSHSIDQIIGTLVAAKTEMARIEVELHVLKRIDSFVEVVEE